MTTTTQRLTIEVPEHLGWRLRDAAENLGLEPEEYIVRLLGWEVDPHTHFEVVLVGDAHEDEIRSLATNIAGLGDIAQPSWWHSLSLPPHNREGWVIEADVRDAEIPKLRSTVRALARPSWVVELVTMDPNDPASSIVERLLVQVAGDQPLPPPRVRTAV